MPTLRDGRIRWTYHVSMRLLQRNLNGAMLLEGAATLEIIESYPNDKYSPSYLLRGQHGQSVFHVQAAADLAGNNVRIVTMYKPEPEDLPFKLGDTNIVIVRSLPALQCAQCGDTELENDTMRRVDEVLSRVDAASELEVVRFAA